MHLSWDIFTPPPNNSEHCNVQDILSRTQYHSVPRIQVRAKHSHAYPICNKLKRKVTSLSHLQISSSNNFNRNNPSVTHYIISVKNSPNFALVEIRWEDDGKIPYLQVDTSPLCASPLLCPAWWTLQQFRALPTDNWIETFTDEHEALLQSPAAGSTTDTANVQEPTGALKMKYAVLQKNGDPDEK